MKQKKGANSFFPLSSSGPQETGQCPPTLHRTIYSKESTTSNANLVLIQLYCRRPQGKVAVPAHEALASGRPHRPWWMPALFSAVAWGYGLNEGKKCRRGGWRSGAGGGPDVAWRLGGTLVGPGAPCRGTRYPHERPALRLTFRGTCAGSRGECPAFLATSQAPGRWTRAHGAQAAPCPDEKFSK